MRVVAVEARIGRELATHFGHMFSNIDLCEPGRASGKLTVAEFAEFTRAANRHLGDFFAFFQVRVQCGGTVAKLAPQRCVDAG